MRWLRSFAIAFSMYSKIPMPRVSWRDEGMKYALCFFPLIGLVIGGVYLLFGRAAEALDLAETARVCIRVLIPLAVTGGIHMDGYLDTADARCSYGDREKKLGHLDLLYVKHGTGCITEINDHLFEGRYSPMWIDGKKHSRNVYAHTREECEEKLHGERETTSCVN